MVWLFLGGGGRVCRRIPVWGGVHLKLFHLGSGFSLSLRATSRSFARRVAFTSMAATPALEALPEFTLDEVLTHNSKQSLWLPLHGLVYDVTAYFIDHPGGFDVLFTEQMRGQDLGHIFETTNHSHEARELSQKYLVGRVAGAKLRPMYREGEYEMPGNKQLSNKRGDDDSTMIILGLGVAVLAALVVFNRKKIFG